MLMARLIGKPGGKKLKSVAIASYGPFRSLRRTDKELFGQVHEKVSHFPLRGFNLSHMFFRGIKESGGNEDAFITVHTDAEACALGEAIARDLPDDHLLHFILVTEGVGLGVISGRSILKSALHSEIGLLHVRFDARDPLKPARGTRLYSKSLSELADNASLRRRAFHFSDGKVTSDDELELFPDETLWNLRAYYLAQACLASTVTLPPHKIVLGADIDHMNSIGSRASRQFYAFLDERRIADQPAFEFTEMYHEGMPVENFISSMTSGSPIELARNFQSLGAWGMCYAAATAHRGAEFPHHLKPKSQNA